MPVDHQVPVNENVDSISFVVGGFHEATGFGLHLSTDADSNGHGGQEADFHFLRQGGGGDRILAVAYDGVVDQKHHVNQFRADLGPKEDISHAVVTVTRRLLSVEAVRISRSPHADERLAYTVSASFPLREASGLFRGEHLHIRLNGVLSGHGQRGGSGYRLLQEPLVSGKGWSPHWREASQGQAHEGDTGG